MELYSCDGMDQVSLMATSFYQTSSQHGV